MKASESVLSRWLPIPLTIPTGFRNHVLLLIPLILTQLLQRLEHVVDNRFIGRFGFQALAVHNIQYNFFLVGQAIGIASATSALIFWKRQEAAGKQGSILKIHLFLTMGIATIVAAAVFPFVPNICEYFSVAQDFRGVAEAYLRIGLVNMVFQASYAPLNAMLIGLDRRKQSLFIIAGILLSKVVLASAALSFGWSGNPVVADLAQPMLSIALGTSFILVLSVLYAQRIVGSLVDGRNRLELRQIVPVWGAELGIAAVRSVTPLVYCFQVARAQASTGFFVTYQMTLHLAYLLILPLLSGMQVAIRDASAEQSSQTASLSPFASKWWPSFFFASFAPTIFLLVLGATSAVPLFNFFYGYEVPLDHRPFLPLYFLACMVGQVGHLFLIQLRARKQNWMATRNFLLAETGVQLGFTQVLISSENGTPAFLGLVILAYCAVYLALNWYSVRSMNSGEVRT